MTGTRERCRQLIEAIRQIENEHGYLQRLEAGPAEIFSAWPTGMPRGTNDPIMALLQRVDVNEAIDRIEAYCRELDEIA